MDLKKLNSKTKYFYINSTIEEIFIEKSDLELYNDILSLENERNVDELPITEKLILVRSEEFRTLGKIQSKLIKAREYHTYNQSKIIYPNVYSENDTKCQILQKLLLEELWRQSGNDQLTFTDYLNDLNNIGSLYNGINGIKSKSSYEIHISYIYDCVFIDSVIMRSYAGDFKLGNNQFKINDPKYEFGSKLRSMKYHEGTYIIKNENLYRSKKDGLLYKHQYSEF
jgi:hypothetical protein